MPVYNFSCDNCSNEFKKLLPVAESEFTCKVCGTLAKRKQKSVPSTSTYEHLDNGLMHRALDRPADAARLFRERSEQFKREHMPEIDDDDLDVINPDGDPV